jgi:mannosyltransferase OCH1-like enzyme
VPAIPRVVHRIWLGDAPMPDAHVAFGDTWRQHHPGWTVRLWTDSDAPEPAGSERARNLGERTDLIRYEILRRHGGVYVDTDVECLRPLDGLLTGVAAFAAYEVPGRLCNAVLGSIPGHPAFARASQFAGITCGYGTYPEATATTFLTYILEACDDVTLFGPERFYPRLWNGARNLGNEPPYADHHWGASWLAARAESATSSSTGT